MISFLGHHAPRGLAGVFALLIALTLLPPIPYAVIWLPLLLTLLLVVIVLAASLLSHNRGLCERCIRSVPLEASAAASKFSLRFRVTHLFENRVLAFGCVAVIVGTAFLYAHPVGKYAWAAVQASLGYLVLSYMTHQRLQPWCPFCRNGGEEQVTPTTPTPVSSTL